MPSCSFNGCTNSTKTKTKAEDITFHSFPPDEPQRHKWLLVVRQQRKEPDWTPTNNSRICSIHFRTEDMYTTNKGYRKVFKCAVPNFEMIRPEETSISRENEKINNNDRLQLANEYSSSTNFKVCDLPELLNKTNTADSQAHGVQKRKLAATEAANYPPSTSMSLSASDNVNISDLETIIETPMETFLKKKLSKATMRNRRLVQDNINLNKKNLRLIRSCKRLKETVTQLKKVVKSMVNK